MLRKRVKAKIKKKECHKNIIKKLFVRKKFDKSGLTVMGTMTRGLMQSSDDIRKLTTIKGYD